MSNKINCPFCNNEIFDDANICEYCAAIFAEPNLKNIKFKELVPFTIIDCMTFGFFSTIWFFLNGKALNNLSTQTKDNIKLNWLISLLALNGATYLFFIFEKPIFTLLFSAIQVLIYIALTYRSLKIIQKYTLQTYKKRLETNLFYIFVFNIFYLVHYIDTYAARVEDRHALFNWKSFQGVVIIILLLIILFILRFYNEILLIKMY